MNGELREKGGSGVMGIREYVPYKINIINQVYKQCGGGGGEKEGYHKYSGLGRLGVDGGGGVRF